MKKIFTLCVVLCMSYLSMGATNLKHEFRATWLTTAWGNDWPKTKVTNDATRKQQQDSLIAIFDRLQAGNMNAVCFQVRGRSDAFYQSSYEPWAAELAGARGKDPGYDPLAFAIEEAHKRGLELHAWVNPFRVTSAGTLASTDLVKKNAGQWIIQYNNGSFTGEIIDPGYPEAREYVLNVLMEIISNYDIDGIVMDDYFYPYGGTTTEDAASKALHKPANVVDVNQDGYTDDDWRRSNVDVFLKEFYNRIQTTKPWVRLGMGTFGIWTTQTKVAQAYGIALPSGISGLDDYDEQACNPVEWVQNGYVDYINPQLYWPTTSTGQNYNKLCQWWAKDVCEHFSNQLTNGKKVHFFSSQSISSNSAVSEIQAEIDANRNNLSSGSTGSVFFDTDAYLNMDNALMTSRFATHALPPPMDWKSNTALAAPTNLTVSGSMLSWQHATAERFTVYVYPKGTAWSTAKNDPSYLQGVIYGNSLDINGIDTNMNDIAVCAYDRFGVEHTAAVYSNDSGAGTTPNPETIIWELNGGEVNTVTVEVPSLTTLEAQFKNDYNSYFGASVATTREITNFLYYGSKEEGGSNLVYNMMNDPVSDWTWLRDYIISKSASNTTIQTALLAGTDAHWRYSIVAFLTASAGTNSTYTVDFSIAGQPSKWGTAYQIAHGAVLLPTYVTSAFTLPIPTHPEGHDFLGWYDNAEFIGSPLTTISADWTGSLYAKWHIIDLTWQITYTSTNGNIVTPNATDVFGANIVSYTYQDGQGVITFDGPVTSIGEKAFYQCKSLASITIPNSVTSIGESAFSECTSLSSVTIPNSVTSIRDWAFSYCSSLRSITIPNSVTSIGNSAFLCCSSLNAIYITDIAAWCNISFGNNEANPLYDAHNLYLNGKLVTDLVIPNSVTSIRDWAFSYCSSLRSITIPNSVTSIGEHAFYDCSSLTSVTIPNSVTSIGSSAFSYCSSLTSITIPNSVTSIGNGAFEYCSSLTSITIPNSVTSIGYNAFYGCSSLTSVTIPNSVTSIGDGAFYDCSSLTSVTIPNSVTSIGDGAFYDCSSLTSVTIPNSVTSIGDCAFYDCSSLTSITIPGSVTNIGEGAFAWCTKLGSVYVKCLTPPTIAANAFYKTSPICYIPCGTLSAYKTSNWSSQLSKFIEECEENTITYTTSDGNIVTPYASDVFGVNIVSNTYSNGQGVITFDGPVTSIGLDAFYNCSVLTSITIPNSVTSIGERAFSYCSSLISITIPNSVTNIGSSAFSDCSSLTSIAIPNSVTSIGDRAFYNCSSLTSIAIPNSVTSIGDRAFYNCSSLTSIAIPNSVTSIGDYAFRGCSSLTSIAIPNSVTSIGISAFGYCSSITSMTVENGNTVYDSREKCNAIIETATNTLIVGCQNTTIPNNVTSIGDYAFRGCSSLTSVTIPSSVTSIGDRAFYNCSSLTSVTIGENVTSIGDLAFYDTGIYNDESNWENKVLYIDDCLIDARASISGAYTINENARLIANRAFGDCSSLTSITIPNSVTSIGSSAFYKCSSLTSITIPGSVTNIGEGAFAWCTKLGFVYVKCLTPPTIAADAFDNTSPICCIPCGTLSTYKTSNWSSQLSKFIEECEENTITYTSSNGNIVTPYASDVFGANIVSNTYSNGQGVITFDGPVTSIGDRAFHNCSSLTSITIPNSVTSIGDRAFYSYVGSSLTSITIPNSVTSIGLGAFSGCYSLTSITIPNSVTSIGYNAFYGCSSLTSVTIGENVTSIGDLAFYECSRLTSIVIPNSVTSIGEFAFQGCSSLSDITLTAHSIEEFYRGKVNCLLIDKGVSNAARHLQINDIEITELTISESVTSVGDYAFYNCSSLTSITIPNSVTSIGSHAFYGCSSLTSATIPESVSSIGEGATFQKCTELKHVYWNATNCTIEQNSNGNYYPPFSSLNNLEEFKFGDNVTNIPIYLCYKLAGLKAIVIPNSVTSIGTGAFSGCSSLTSVTIPNSVTSIGKYAFQDCSSLTSVTIPNSVTSIGTYVFQNCSSLISANIGNNVTNVRDYTFSGCSSLTSVTIPNSVTSIGKYAFQDCSSLTSVTIPNSVTSIGKYAFQDCSSLTSVTIPNSVTSVESSAFNDCKALNKITLPASIRSIGPNAFAGCTKLYDIYCFAMEPPTAYESSFANYNAFLHVPCDNQRVYLLDVLFGNFKYIECIEAETTPTDTVVVTPSFNDAEFIWPSNSSADSYTLAISKDGEIFCTLTFNANGQLTGIAFAPSRNGQHKAPAAAQTANGFAFTVTGLDEGSNYTYELLIQDRSGNTLQSYSGEFCTQSTNDHTVTVEYDAAQGIVTGAGTYLVGDTVTLTAIPNYGYHFVQWSDGNTDNPRTLVLTQDTILTAEFALTISGQCGDNLYWAYDEASKTIAITGSGDMYDYTKDTQPWLLFQDQITEVTTSNTTTSIGDWAFDDCSGLTSVTIGNSVTSIGDYAFEYCSSLTSITIPNSVTSIGYEAFWGCSSLDTIHLEATTPPVLQDRSVFMDTPSPVCVIPCGTLATYQSSDWANQVGSFVEDCPPASAAITYVLNGGVQSEWETPQTMYNELNAVWNAFSGTSKTWGNLEDLKANVANGIPTQAGTMALDFIADENFKAKFEWLVTYMDAKCTEQGQTLPSSNASFLRYNLQAFFIDGMRTSWPISADYTICGVSTVEAYQPYWKSGFANPTNPTEEFILNAPYREGYTFVGWYTTPNFSGEKVTTINAETTGTLYAKWVEYIPTIAEVWNMEEGVETKISGVVNWVRYGNVFIQDITGGFRVYIPNDSTRLIPEVGTKIIAKGVRGSFAGSPQLNDAVVESSEPATLAEPIVTTLTDLCANPLKYFGQRVSVQGVYVAEYDSYGNIYVAERDGSNKVKGHYMVVDPIAFPVGTKVSITAVASQYDGAFQFEGDIAGIELAPGPKRDTYEYPIRNEKYTLTNDWVISNIEGNFAANKLAQTDSLFVRGMAAKDGIMYFINRETQSLIRVDGATGHMLDPIKITGEHLFEVYDEEMGEWKSGVIFGYNDIKFDQAGNCLIGACTTGGATRCQTFFIYIVDLETGVCTKLIEDVLWDNPSLDQVQFRFDAFGVAGDVTKNGVVMAADAQSWNVYRWLIKNGVVGDGEQINCALNAEIDESLFIETENFGTAPQIFPQDELGELFYVDGASTLPMLFDGDGMLLDDFINVPTGTNVWNSNGDTISINSGHLNGLIEFQVGEEYFLLMAATYSTHNVPSTFALYKFADENRAFSGMEPLWYFPHNGMGSNTNGYRTAVPSVDIIDNNTAKLYLYVGENGYACYTLNVGDKTVEPIDPTWQITYTSSNDSIVTPYATDVFGANIVSNIYENGVGTITFDGPVTSIGNNAFYECSSLTSIIIPNSITSIGDRAFQWCDGLTSITIPDSVTSIGEYAFRICDGLTSITIPNSVTSIRSTAFSHCKSIVSMVVADANAVYDSRNGCNAIIETATNTLVAGCQNTIIPNSVTKIGESAFNCCYGLTSIAIPNSVTEIGGDAFSYCSSLSSVTIPNSVTSIGSFAFGFCINLASVFIPNSITNIESTTFYSCTSLTSITIPNSVTHIGHQAFLNCTSLTTIHVEATTPPALEDSTVFMNTPSPICVIPCGTLAAYQASDWASQVSEFVEEGCVPIQMCGDDLYWEYADGVLTITGTGDMYDYAKDTDVPWYDVRGNIKTINMPDEMTKIGDYAFYKCTALTSVTLPEQLKHIGNRAFAQDTKIAGNIVIPEGVNYIEERAFFNLTGVSQFQVLATTPPTLESTNVFTNVNAPIVIPCGYGLVYRKANIWKDLNLSTCEVLIDNLYYIPVGDNEAHIIGYDNKPAGTLTIPGSVVIGSKTRTVTTLADSLFFDCKEISSVIFNEGLESIGERAYVRCGLTGTIVLPSTLTTIGERAFSYCDNVEKYILQAMTPPALANDVFTGSNSKALFYISCEAMDDYKVATNWSSLNSRLRDACLNIYHYNTALGANGVHTTEDTLVASIYYRRQFTTSRWETLYLPFEVDRVTVLEDGVEYDLNAWSIFTGGHYYLAKPYGIENKEVVFGFTQVVDAHTPYIIQFKEPYYHDKMITFHGKESWNKLSTSFEALPISFEMQMAGNTTLQDQILEEPVYMLRASSNFILQNTTTTLHPFECYVMPYATPSGTPARMNVRFRGDVPTAVESVKGNESHLTYTVDGYTLTVYPQGQAFSIYSLNGALIYSCEAGKEAVDCELNSGCYLLHAGTEAHKIML